MGETAFGDVFIVGTAFGPEQLAWFGVCVGCYAFVWHLPARAFAPLLPLPAIWIAAVAWETASLPMLNPITANDDLLSYVRQAAIAQQIEQIAFGAALLFAVWAMKEARVLAAAFAMLNLRLLELAPMLAVMSGLAYRD